MSEFHRCQHVQPDDVLVLGPGHLVELALRVAAGVVDEDIDVAERGLGGAGEAPEVFGIGEVGGDGDHGPAGWLQLFRQGVDIFGRAAREDEVVAGLGERVCDMRSDASRGTGDQSCFGCYGHCLGPPSLAGASHALTEDNKQCQ